MRRKNLLWVPCFFAVALVFVASAARAEPDLLHILGDLASHDRDERAAAVEHLWDRPNIHAIAPVLEAAKRETDPDTLERMLLVLGRSGMMEALGLIQTHAQSPAQDLRGAGREALKLWLVTNGVLEDDDRLPDPPHAFYATPPVFPPNRAAGRPIAVWAGEAPLMYPPPYEAADSSGVPPGYHIGEEPRWGLLIGGVATFGGIYVPTVITVAVTEALPSLLIPVVGPMIPAVSMFDKGGYGTILAPFLLLHAAGQLTGVALAIAGGAASSPTLERDGVSVSLSPAGVSVAF